jgi:hypothetical protein
MLTLILGLLAVQDDCRYGTAIEWESSIERAADKANREGKLLLVLHISGNFEDPGKT